MPSFRITFLPFEKTVEVEPGTTLMEAAQKSGVEIANLCGGNGVCGKCKVRVVDGRIYADKHSISLLSREEIKQGYVLACQTKVDGPMTIEIPPESTLEEGQILMEGVQVDYSKPERISVHRVSADPLSLFAPLVRKVFLELKAPTPQDNINDLERVLRELRKMTGQPEFEIALGCLQGLASKLRDHEWKATATLAAHGETLRIMQIEPGDTTVLNYGLAVDVGTTTVVAQLVDLASGNVMGVAGSHNLQARYGEDVISRMIYACGKKDGLDPLHGAVIENINQLIRTLTEDKGIDPRDITALVAAGNTTMSHLLLSLVPCSIRLDPYVPTTTIYPQVRAAELGIQIHPAAIVETIPGVASYVGGDIVAGVLACGMADRPEVTVLMDVGTNGEIAVGNNEWLVCCSASAGPAFEGGGIKYGMRATNGAIEKASLSDGEVRYQTIGGKKPRGICGSGLIDCLCELARTHLVDGDGSFRVSAGHPRMMEKDGEVQFVLAYPEETETGQEVAVTQSDIRHLIRSKGAVFAAIKSLMDYVGLRFEDIHTLFVAGGFGSYLDVPKAIHIGLLPDMDQARIRYIGNSSLMGARMCLLSTHTLKRSVQVARSMTNIELSRYQPFMDEYVAAMFLPHTDRRLFPSVTY
ncbi:MAG: ASKHA domain-containing protein [Thermodesulfobacteriota bacterium]